MPIGATIGAAAAGVGSALIGASAASKAASAQKNATKKASNTTMQMYEQNRADLQPYAGTGGSALTSIANMYGLPTADNPAGGQAFSPSALEAFRNSPDYQVALQEGIRARDYSAASKGNLLSGGQEKRIAQYGSDLASQKFEQYMSNLYRLAGMGQNAAAGQGAAATGAGSNLSNLTLAAGQAQASGDVGVGSALSTGLTGAANNLGYLAMRNPSAYGKVGTISDIPATSNGLY